MKLERWPNSELFSTNCNTKQGDIQFQLVSGDPDGGYSIIMFLEGSALCIFMFFEGSILCVGYS